MELRITETAELSSYEQAKAKKEPDSLLVGKSDKTLNVLSAGVLIPIKELSVANRTGSNVGTLTIPTAEGIPFVIQYGRVTIGPNASVTVTFPTPFANACFQVIPSQSNGTEASNLKALSSTTTQFTLNRIGGTVDEIASWLAIGF